MREEKIIIDDVETTYVAYEDGTIKNMKNNRIIKGSITNEGYQRIQLTINGKLKSVLGHKLIAMCFLENPNNYKYITHINGDRSDNRVENLQWVEKVPNTEKRKDRDKAPNINPFDGTWKQIPSVDYCYINKEGIIYNTKTNKTSIGSLRCGYRRKEIDGKVFSIHRLVYETFVGKIPEGMVIDHIDGDKSNNNVENLRCVTQSENMKNSYKKGHKGQNPVRQYDLEHNYIKTWPSCTAAAQEYGVTYRAISGAADRGGTSCGFYWEKVEK